jgi:broad specificity phosphatase PhoE
MLPESRKTDDLPHAVTPSGISPRISGIQFSRSSNFAAQFGNLSTHLTNLAPQLGRPTQSRRSRMIICALTDPGRRPCSTLIIASRITERVPRAMTSKAILCIRHGESTFNAFAAESSGDPLHYDARLSKVGEQQVRRAREKLRQVAVELVITSPLTRALQTAAGLFADHPSSPPILVERLHRERVENSCDVGRSPAILAQEFPNFVLNHLPEVWWYNHGDPDERGICVEPIEAVELRAIEFRSLLSLRPERVIAVVGHGTFFYNLTGQMLANCEVARFTLDQ